MVKGAQKLLRRLFIGSGVTGVYPSYAGALAAVPKTRKVGYDNPETSNMYPFLLELSRVDSGELELAQTECDLARIARDSLEFIGPLAKQKNAVLRDSLQSVTVRGDAARLGQVIINLLNNALQHNADGVEISLTVERKGDNAILRVADNGVGIPAEALPQVFDRFYRADKSRSSATGGHGLGLAISKAIIEAHHGSIRAESEPGRGVAFIIELPLK